MIKFGKNSLIALVILKCLVVLSADLRASYAWPENEDSNTQTSTQQDHFRNTPESHPICKTLAYIQKFPCTHECKMFNNFKENGSSKTVVWNQNQFETATMICENSRSQELDDSVRSLNSSRRTQTKIAVPGADRPALASPVREVLQQQQYMPMEVHLVNSTTGEITTTSENVPLDQITAMQNANRKALQDSKEIKAKLAATAKTEARSLSDACENDTSQAKSFCGENNQELVAIGGLADQLASTMTTDLGANCQRLNKFSVAAKAGIAGYAAMCGGAQLQCSSSCSDARKRILAKMKAPENATNEPLITALEKEQARVEGHLGVCRQFVTNLAAAATNTMKIKQMIDAGKACESQTAAGDWNAWCAKNPGTIACAKSTDCNVASNANEPVCKCMRNPRDPVCSSMGMGNNPYANIGKPNSGGGSTDAVTLLDKNKLNAAKAGALGGPDGDSSMDGEVGMGKANPAGGGGSLAKGGSGGGGGGFQGGNGGPGGPKPAPGPAGSNLITRILGGSYGGGGGSWGGSGGYYGGSGGGSGGYTTAAAAAAARAGQQLDLKKYLPGGAHDPTRGLAGISGPDGITGPNTSIWSKIRVRYNSVSSTLRP